MSSVGRRPRPRAQTTPFLYAIMRRFFFSLLERAVRYRRQARLFNIIVVSCCCCCCCCCCCYFAASSSPG
ncbi:unnamed protein product [Trichogramma brassicae]|uniref:Uncharacterized protein n=1 Tax=Trichogramma brassicae TaxID=86971 RepID=A0A6H5J4N1_9HYME|nr:unnamed protein product [Trichogramma brassicae]